MAKVLHSKFTDVKIPENISLTDYLMQSAKQFGNKLALIDAASGASFTYNQVIEKIHLVSSGLWNQGLRQRDVVLLCLPNCIEYPIIFHAIVAQGAVPSTCNPIYTEYELARQINDCEAEFIFITQAHLPKILNLVSKLKKSLKKIVVVDRSDIADDGQVLGYETLLISPNSSLPLVTIQPRSDPAVIMYSSGTSGMPKGVALSHYNVIANTCQLHHPDMRYGYSSDVNIAFLPFFHSYGVVVYLCYMFISGATVVVMKEFDPIKYLTCCEKYKATVLHIVPPVAIFLTKHPLVLKYDLSSVYEIICGGAPLKEQLSEELCMRFNCKYIRQGYAMTEVLVATFSHPDHHKHGSSGIVMPNVKLQIVDIGNGASLGKDKQGEIWIKSPQTMLGYINNSKATQETIDDNGWLHTGDVGYYDDDGHIFIVDRLKELIKYKGFQVAPAELESVILTHPAVTDVAVIGIPDDAAGELPRAYIVIKPEQYCNEQEIHDFLKNKVAPYKKLRGGVIFRSKVPKTASGKIQRNVLREEYRQQTKSKL